MGAFLEQLALDLLNKHNNDLSGICLVFPSRRAGLYFKKIYASKLSKPAWSPTIYAIEDFISSISELQVADQLELAFDLYSVYQKYFPDESFDKFYPWGILLLNDFNDIDANLVNAQQLFATIKDIRDLENQFDLEDEERARILEFWKSYYGKAEDTSELRKKFYENWKHLGSIYADFRERLMQKGVAYPGLASREVSEKLTTIDPSTSSGQALRFTPNNYVFAGFNALTKAEEKIINHFVKSGKGELHYDADAYYINDVRQEAGTFLRKKVKAEHLSNDLLTEGKSIESIGVSLQSLQPKVATQILSSIPPEQLNKTAVVLPDEQLLIPLLYSLPSTIEDINVTMGYPCSTSPMFRLIEGVFELQKSFRNNPPSFQSKNVFALLHHPFLQQLFIHEIRDWQKDYIDEPTVRISQATLLKSNAAVFQLLFITLHTTEDYLNFFNRLFALLINTVRTVVDGLLPMEKEHVSFFYIRFKKIEEIISKYSSTVSPEMFRNLFREVIYTSKIPFTGEPLKGLQIMGLLETRVLDFDNVIILSMNEGQMPAVSHKASFIPYNIRKAYRLPVNEEQNSIAAYHFYRLLQRTKNLYMIYNTEVKSVQGGEKSRFILQIENELLKKNPGIRYRNTIVDVPLKATGVPPSIAIKDPKVMQALGEYFKPPTSRHVKQFSPSALSSYINCKLQFYYQRIQRIKEPDAIEETIEGALFGTIFHEVMYQLYKSFKVLTVEKLAEIEKNMHSVIDHCIAEHFSATDSLEGKNILMRSVMIELVNQIIAYDKKNAPVKVRHLEKEVRIPFKLKNGQTVQVYGKIDRIDEVNGGLQVIDYKTGRGDKGESKTIAELFAMPEYKEQFQTFFYCWLLHKDKHTNLKAGLFRMRELSKGIQFINKNEVITSEQFDEFESHLQNLLEEIFNPELPFQQTEDEGRCIFCTFKDICNR